MIRTASFRALAPPKGLQSRTVGITAVVPDAGEVVQLQVVLQGAQADSEVAGNLLVRLDLVGEQVVQGGGSRAN